MKRGRKRKFRSFEDASARKHTQGHSPGSCGLFATTHVFDPGLQRFTRTSKSALAQRCVESHELNARVSLFVPGWGKRDGSGGAGSGRGGDTLAVHSIKPTPLYTGVAPISAFLHPDWLKNYGDGGTAEDGAVAVTAGVAGDRDTVASLTSSGRLTVCVDKDTYERLGLDGRPYPFGASSKSLRKFAAQRCE